MQPAARRDRAGSPLALQRLLLVLAAARVAAQPRDGEAISAQEVGTCDAFWRDPGTALTQTSLIVDPPDGRLPALTADGQRRAAARTAAQRARGCHHPWEDFSAYSMHSMLSAAAAEEGDRGRQ